jgi:hypothetical protein
MVCACCHVRRATLWCLPLVSRSPALVGMCLRVGGPRLRKRAAARRVLLASPWCSWRRRSVARPWRLSAAAAPAQVEVAPAPALAPGLVRAWCDVVLCRLPVVPVAAVATAWVLWLCGSLPLPPAAFVPAMNKYDRNPVVAVSPDGLSCQARHEVNWAGIRANVGVAAAAGGKFYYEVAVLDEGLCRVGWASPAASLELGTDAEVRSWWSGRGGPRCVAL